MRRHHILTAALVGLALAGSARAQQGAPAGGVRAGPKAPDAAPADAGTEAPPAPVLLRDDQLLGALVVDGAGKDVGRIDDIAVDMQDGRAQFVAVEVGRYVQPNVASEADRLAAIPLELLRRKTDHLLLTGVSRAQVATANLFTADSWPDSDNRAWISNEWKHFDRAPYWKDVETVLPPPPPRRAAGEEPAPPPPAPQPANAWMYVRLSALLHSTVRNRLGDELGRADAVVLDLGRATVAYAVVTPAASLRLEGRLIAIPWDGMVHGGERLLVDVDKARFPQLPTFDAASWPDFSDPALQKDLAAAFPPRPAAR